MINVATHVNSIECDLQPNFRLFNLMVIARKFLKIGLKVS